METRMIHVCPADDTLDHDRAGHCWCHPTYDIRFDRTVVYHNRADELVAHEIGYARPKELGHHDQVLALPPPQ